MQDMQAHLEKLHTQIAECEMIRDLATDLKKRELFTRLADHFRILAGEIERAMNDQTHVAFRASEAQGTLPRK